MDRSQRLTIAIKRDSGLVQVETAPNNVSRDPPSAVVLTRPIRKQLQPLPIVPKRVVEVPNTVPVSPLAPGNSPAHLGQAGGGDDDLEHPLPGASDGSRVKNGRKGAGRFVLLEGDDGAGLDVRGPVGVEEPCRMTHLLG